MFIIYINIVKSKIRMSFLGFFGSSNRAGQKK